MRLLPVFNPALYPRSYQAPPVGSRGDLEIFAAIAERLIETGAFTAVVLGGTNAWRETPGEPPVFAVVTPEAFEELTDPSTTTIIRHVQFTLHVIARVPDPAESYCLLAGRVATAQNTLDRSDLGGLVLSELSRLTRGRFELGQGALPGHASLHGEFGYTVTNAGSRIP